MFKNAQLIYNNKNQQNKGGYHMQKIIGKTSALMMVLSIIFLGLTSTATANEEKAIQWAVSAENLIPAWPETKQITVDLKKGVDFIHAFYSGSKTRLQSLSIISAQIDRLVEGDYVIISVSEIRKFNPTTNFLRNQTPVKIASHSLKPTRIIPTHSGGAVLLIKLLEIDEEKEQAIFSVSFK